MTTQQIRSELLGLFVRDPDPPPQPILTARVRWNDRTEVDVSLVALGSEQNWPDLLRRAESLFPDIQNKSADWLRSEADEILRLHREYFGDEWKAHPQELLTHATISNVNFADDGTFDLCYKGDQAFHHLHLIINFDETMNVAGICFDG